MFWDGLLLSSPIKQTVGKRNTLCNCSTHEAVRHLGDAQDNEPSLYDTQVPISSLDWPICENLQSIVSPSVSIQTPPKKPLKETFASCVMDNKCLLSAGAQCNAHDEVKSNVIVWIRNHTVSVPPLCFFLFSHRHLQIPSVKATWTHL